MRWLMAFSLLSLCGCMVFEVGPKSTEERISSEKTEIIAAQRINGVRGEMTDARSKLRVSVDGVFDTETVRTYETRECRRGRMAFGFFPAINEGEQKSNGYYVGGTRCDSRWNYIAAVLICEAFVLYTPTLCSLLIEPFRSQPSPRESRFSYLSLFGFYRYNVPEDWTVVDRWTGRTRQVERRYEVPDFEIIHDGKQLASRNGQVSLPKAEVLGERLRARLVSAASPCRAIQETLDKSTGTDMVWQDTNTAWLVRLKKTYERRPTISPLPREKFVGKWICEQECACSQVLGLSTSTRRQCVIQHWPVRYEYEFFDDGEFLLTCLKGRDGDAEIGQGAEQTFSHGTWAFDHGGLVITEHNSLGANVKMTIKLIWYSEDEYEMLFNLRELEQFFNNLPDVLSCEMSYEDNGVRRESYAMTYMQSGVKGVVQNAYLRSPRICKRVR